LLCSLEGDGDVKGRFLGKIKTMNKIKIIATVGAVGTGLVATFSHAFGAIVAVPSYTDLVTVDSTAFAQGLFTDLVPWVAVFIAVIVGTLALKAIYGKVTGGAKRLLGGGRKGRSRRRR